MKPYSIDNKFEILGLDKSLFESNYKTGKYFKPKNLHGLIKMQESRRYPNLKDFKLNFVKQLNDPFKNDLNMMRVTRTTKYLSVKCKYQNCVFRLWYFEGKTKDTKGTDIQWHRSINLNHSFDCHINKVLCKIDNEVWKILIIFATYVAACMYLGSSTRAFWN